MKTPKKCDTKMCPPQTKKGVAADRKLLGTVPPKKGSKK